MHPSIEDTTQAREQAMLQSERTTKAGQIERTIHVAMWSNTIHATITETKQLKTKTTSTSTTYILRPIPSQMGGVGVEVEKLDESGEVYNVLLNAPGLGHSCDCPHGTYRGHVKPCRHIEACLEALKRGLL
jgi:hypothetical protein